VPASSSRALAFWFEAFWVEVILWGFAVSPDFFFVCVIRLL
jgi:hypothetical protein